MSPKGEFERASAAYSSTAKEADATRWRDSIVQLLVGDGGIGFHEAEFLALTVVGMFDAGASDAEVCAFLAPGLSRVDDRARHDLVARMHKSANAASAHRVV
jgi:hypothetical protein